MQWKSVFTGAVGGAVVAVAVVFAAASTGWLPIHLNGKARDDAVHGYLIAHPEILVDMSNELQARADADTDRQQRDAIHKLGLKRFFDPKVAFVTGPASAKTTVVEFFDYNCPYCRASLPAVTKFYDAHKGTTRFAFIEFPIKGPESTVAARAAIAARNQPDKYLAFHDLMMGEDGLVTAQVMLADAKKAGLDIAKLQKDMADPSVDRTIAAAHKLADESDIDGTPTFIINGKMRPGAIDEQQFNQMAKS